MRTGQFFAKDLLDHYELTLTKIQGGRLRGVLDSRVPALPARRGEAVPGIASIADGAGCWIGLPKRTR